VISPLRNFIVVGGDLAILCPRKIFKKNHKRVHCPMLKL
jgi:hypothetical protein